MVRDVAENVFSPNHDSSFENIADHQFLGEVEEEPAKGQFEAFRLFEQSPSVKRQKRATANYEVRFEESRAGSKDPEEMAATSSGTHRRLEPLHCRVKFLNGSFRSIIADHKQQVHIAHAIRELTAGEASNKDDGAKLVST